MPAFPSKSLLAASGLDGPTVLTSMGQLYDALVGLLGTTGTQSAALSAIGALFGSSRNLSVAYTVIASDRGLLLECTGTWTLTASSASALGDGFAVAVANVGTGVITFDPAASDTVDGGASIQIGAGRTVILVCDGAKWIAVGKGAVQSVNGQSPDAAGNVYLGSLAGANSDFDYILLGTPGQGTTNLYANYGYGVYLVWSPSGDTTRRIIVVTGGGGQVNLGDWPVSATSGGGTSPAPAVADSVFCPSSSGMYVYKLRKLV